MKARVTEINQTAPLVIRKNMIIKAPPETVWELLSDIDAWSRWQPDIIFAKLEAPLAIGSGFRLGVRRGPSVTSTVQILEPNQRIGWTGKGLSIWTGKGLGMRIIHIWTLKRRRNITSLTTEESLEGWFVRLFGGEMRKAMEESLDTWMRSLKSQAEASPKGL